MLFSDYLKNTKKNGNFVNSLIVQTTACCNYKELAKQYLKTMVCQDGDPYCDICHVCQKINANQYIDFLYLENSNGEILKEEALGIQRLFSSGATEASKVKLYVIKNLELANKFVVNSLLKFIEESPKHTYALFLTNNSQKIIGTIRSRSQLIHITDAIKSFDQITDEKTFELLKHVFNDYDEYLTYIQQFDVHKIIALVDQVKMIRTTAQEVACGNLIKELEKDELHIFIKCLIQSVGPKAQMKLLEIQQTLKINPNKKILVFKLLNACK